MPGTSLDPPQVEERCENHECIGKDQISKVIHKTSEANTRDETKSTRTTTM